MIFKEVKQVSVTDKIIEQIKNLIINDTLKPGESLPSEEKMASQMGVGRGTLREALKVLIYLGFIERKNKTTFVSPNVIKRLHPRDIIESFKKHRNIMEMIELRKIIEPEASAYAAVRANPKEVEEIEKAYRLMVEYENELELFINQDNIFHLAVVEATDNSVLLDIMKGIQKLMKQNQSLILKKSKKIKPRSLDFHRKIFSAIKDGNADLARKCMLNHIIDIEKEMYRILKGDGV